MKKNNKEAPGKKTKRKKIKPTHTYESRCIKDESITVN